MLSVGVLSMESSSPKGGGVPPGSVRGGRSSRGAVRRGKSSQGAVRGGAVREGRSSQGEEFLQEEEEFLGGSQG